MSSVFVSTQAPSAEREVALMSGPGTRTGWIVATVVAALLCAHVANAQSSQTGSTESLTLSASAGAWSIDEDPAVRGAIAADVYVGVLALRAEVSAIRARVTLCQFPTSPCGHRSTASIATLGLRVIDRRGDLQPFAGVGTGPFWFDGDAGGWSYVEAGLRRRVNDAWGVDVRLALEVPAVPFKRDGLSDALHYGYGASMSVGAVYRLR